MNSSTANCLLPPVNPRGKKEKTTEAFLNNKLLSLALSVIYRPLTEVNLSLGIDFA
jgi:hypothetical protein